MKFQHKSIALLVAALFAVSAYSAGATKNPLSDDNEEIIPSTKPVSTKATAPVPAAVASQPAVVSPAVVAKPPLQVAPQPAPAPAVQVAPAPVVMSAPVFTANKSGTFAQLDQLRTRNALLAEQVKAAKYLAELNAPAPTTAGQPNGAAATSAQTTPASAQVVFVSGIDGVLYADVLLVTGAKITRKVGQSIPGVGVVESITRHEVVVKSKTQTFSLPFPSDAPSGMR